MPYIKQEYRQIYDEVLNQLDTKDFQNKGDLEYCIFKLMLIFMQNKDWNYSSLHDAVYASQHCSDEFRRRFLDERENEARQRNGDIYGS